MITAVSGCTLYISENNPTPSIEENESINAEILDEDIDKLLIPIDAVICSIWERGYSYSSQSDEFIWSCIMYIMRDYAYSTEYSSEAMVSIDKEKLTSYAKTLIHGLESLPDNIPEIFSQQIHYSKEDNSYIISPSYREETMTKIHDFTENENETYSLKADLYTSDTEELLGTWEIQLAFNPDYSAENEFSSKLSIKDINLIEVYQTNNTFTKTASFLGLSDTHTAEVMYTNGEIASFQFYSDEVAGKLSEFFEGETFTFVYNQDRETGASEIIEIY